MSTSSKTIWVNHDCHLAIVVVRTYVVHTIKNNEIGVMKTPKKLPRTELNTATASFPPTAFVNITAEDTGGAGAPDQGDRGGSARLQPPTI